MQASANGGDEKRNNHCPEIAVGQRQQPHHNNKSHNIIPNITKYVWRTINATTLLRVWMRDLLLIAQGVMMDEDTDRD